MNEDIIIEKTEEYLRLDVSKIPIGKYKLVPIEKPKPISILEDKAKLAEMVKQYEASAPCPRWEAKP